MGRRAKYLQFNISVLDNEAVIVSVGEPDYGRSDGNTAGFERPSDAKAWLINKVSDAFDEVLSPKQKLQGEVK